MKYFIFQNILILMLGYANMSFEIIVEIFQKVKRGKV